VHYGIMAPNNRNVSCRYAGASRGLDVACLVGAAAIVTCNADRCQSFGDRSADREQLLVQTSVHRAVERLSPLEGLSSKDEIADCQSWGPRLNALVQSMSHNVPDLGDHASHPLAYVAALLLMGSILVFATIALRMPSAGAVDTSLVHSGGASRTVSLPSGSLHREIATVGGQSPDSDAADGELCPDLVHVTHCRLFMPIYPLCDGSFDVKDSSGEALVRVIPRGPSACLSPHAKNAFASPTSSPTNLWRLLLAAPGECGGTLAQCYAVRGSTSFHIRRASGSFFAELSHDGSGGHQYVMVVADGTRYYFIGDHRCGTMRITADDGKECGEVCVCDGFGSLDANTSYYELRCAPLTDAVAMLCGLLCAEWRTASVYSA
jgi:hypothetical protein